MQSCFVRGECTAFSASFVLLLPLTPPWFTGRFGAVLPQPRNTNGQIEIRVCRGDGESGCRERAVSLGARRSRRHIYSPRLVEALRVSNADIRSHVWNSRVQLTWYSISWNRFYFLHVYIVNLAKVFSAKICSSRIYVYDSKRTDNFGNTGLINNVFVSYIIYTYY